MHIGVDATVWQNNRGYGRHARALLRSLVQLDSENRYTFFLDSLDLLEPVPTEARVHQVKASAPAALTATSDGHRSLVDLWHMSRALSGPGFDMLLFPTVYSYVPVVSHAKILVIVHDIIPEKFPELTLPNRSARLFWQMKTAFGRWQADAILTVSNFSRQRLIEQFKIAPESVYVVGEASDPIFRVIDQPIFSPRLASLGISTIGRIVTYVGGFGPHKNLISLVKALAELVSQGDFNDVMLIMVGEYEREVFYSQFETLKGQIQDLKLGSHVTFTGYLPDEELVHLLNLSTVLVLPSLMEGFGLPAVEAAACGCPVIATAASPLPELLGNGGIYVDPLHPDELRSALELVLGSEKLQQQMRAAGLRAVRSLTWEKAAHQMIDVIKQVAT